MRFDDDEDDDTFDLSDIKDDAEGDEEGDPNLEAGDEDTEGDAPPPPKKGNPVYGELRQTKRQLREAQDALARQGGQIDTLTRTMSMPRVDPREEQERIANMSPQEYADYKLGLERGQIQQAFGTLQFQVGDATDIRDFDRLCRKNPAYAKIEDEVEERIMKLRSQGQNVSRRAMANQMLGEKFAAKSANRPAKPETQRRTRVGASSDVPNDTRQVRTKAKNAKGRLDGVTF